MFPDLRWLLGQWNLLVLEGSEEFLIFNGGTGWVVEFGQIDDRFDDLLPCFLIQIHQEMDRIIFRFLGRIGSHKDRGEIPRFAVVVSFPTFIECQRGAQSLPDVFYVTGYRPFTKSALGGERGTAWKPTSSDLQIELNDAGDLGLIHGEPPVFWVDWCVMGAL